MVTVVWMNCRENLSTCMRCFYAFSSTFPWFDHSFSERIEWMYEWMYWINEWMYWINKWMYWCLYSSREGGTQVISQVNPQLLSFGHQSSSVWIRERCLNPFPLLDHTIEWSHIASWTASQSRHRWVFPQFEIPQCRPPLAGGTSGSWSVMSPWHIIACDKLILHA